VSTSIFLPEHEYRPKLIYQRLSIFEIGGLRRFIIDAAMIKPQNDQATRSFNKLKIVLFRLSSNNYFCIGRCFSVSRIEWVLTEHNLRKRENN
jgi:hypothetical protein